MLRELVYKVYERQLERLVRRGPLPKHVGVILDGNRRYARKMGYSFVTDGHRRGADKVEDLVDWCDGLRIPVVTLWALSTDNLQRAPEELDTIFGLIEEKVEALVDQRDRAVPRRGCADRRTSRRGPRPCRRLGGGRR